MKVGLAVDDIKGILESAEVTRIESKVLHADNFATILESVDDVL